MAKITNITSTAIADAAASEPASSAPPMRGTSRKAGVKPAAHKTQSRQRAAKPEPAEVADAPSATDGSSASRTTKASIVLELLRQQPAGVSVADLSAATGWQAHSVRGFLSAVVRKKHGLMVTSEIGSDGVRRYRIPGDV